MKYPEDYINKVIQGDSLSIMKQMSDKCVDLVLTDPPYGINVGGRSRERESKITTVGIKGVSNPKSYLGFDDTRIPTKEVFDEMKRISKNQIIFGGNYFIEYLDNSPCWIVWDKDNQESFFADCELAWTSFSTAVRKFKWKWNGMIQEQMGKNKEERHHPTQKPVELFKWILSNYSKQGQTVLDPFLGSGTTMIAAKQLGIDAIGIELSPEYCEVARSRLAQDLLF